MPNQVALNEGLLVVALPNVAPHDAKAFSVLVMGIENSDSVFDKHPQFIDLLNWRLPSGR